MLTVIKLPKARFLIIGVLFLFLFLFPKGGIKLAGNPITIGYLIFLLTGFALLFKKTSLISPDNFQVSLYLFLFQLSSLISLFLNGFDHLGILFSFILHFFIFPFIFFILFPREISQKTSFYILKWIKQGLRFISIYGIFLFFLKILTGKFIEIPFLTVNYHDFHLLEIEKCIDRGGFFKLISTYNNGNLYGICTLMFYPLYTHIEKNKLFKFLVVLSLLLTLSRTVWIGLLVAEILLAISNKNTLAIFKNLSVILFIGGSLSILTVTLNLPIDFFLDKTLGHRIEQFHVLKTFSFFGEGKFSGIYEITYLGIYKSFGICGLLTFILAMFYPVHKNFCTHHKKFVSKLLALGLLIYNIISLSDGALLLIPVMCFYWFIAWFSLELNQSKIFVKFNPCLT